jgi:hypothetical protein
VVPLKPPLTRLAVLKFEASHLRSARLPTKLEHGPKSDRIEDVIVKSLLEYLIAQKEPPSSSGKQTADRKVLQDSIARIDVHEDHLVIRLKLADDKKRPARSTTICSPSLGRSRRPGTPGAAMSKPN